MLAGSSATERRRKGSVVKMEAEELRRVDCGGGLTMTWLGFWNSFIFFYFLKKIIASLFGYLEKSGLYNDLLRMSICENYLLHPDVMLAR